MLRNRGKPTSSGQDVRGQRAAALTELREREIDVPAVFRWRGQGAEPVTAAIRLLFASSTDQFMFCDDPGNLAQCLTWTAHSPLHCP
jgi:hypothetical protein